jgi:hypothetical protein
MCFPEQYPRTHSINLLKAELNSICHLLALLGAHLIFHVSRIRVKTHCGPTERVKLCISTIFVVCSVAAVSALSA